MRCVVFAFVSVALVGLFSASAQESRSGAATGVNLALVAEASTSFVSGHETITAINDGLNPRNSDDKSNGAYGNWPRSGTQWVQYEWSQPISTGKVEVYWFDDSRGVRLPKACRLKYWDGSSFVAVADASGPGLAKNKYNAGTFAEVRTTKLRLEMDSDGTFSTGILEWKVYDSGKSPNFAPSVKAGVDRVVVLPGKTYLNGAVKDDGKANAAPVVAWSKQSGPGAVTFAKADAAITTATFSAAGAYVLRLTANDGQLSASDTLDVVADPPPPAAHLTPVYTSMYKIDNPLWNHRLKRLIINWIPHCYNKISDPAVKEGGIENFTEAGKKLAGQPHKNHVGAVFANAWVHNTVEAMCVALMVDPQGDPEIISAQNAIRQKLDDWIPKLLSAQEPDGYLQTCYTLNNLRRWTNKHDHEGYLAGYFIESAIAHYQMTRGADRRMYDAAKKLADCWYNNIGPAPKRAWHEGHQELEQALVRLARFVEDVEGAGKGRKYVVLAKFLMDSRKDGDEYDQSHLPAIQQYEAVGHAVRAVYSYSGMADIAMETADVDYHSAVRSLWSNIVNKKYYVTGGVGSGETAEGFGKDYSLPNNSYCESCAGCGELFFQYKLNLIYHDAKYADLYEETIYNAILGGVDLEAKNFTYTNALDSSGARYPWHGCPCCVGNIPRTLLMLPTWMYTKDADSLYVNLFVGSTVTVGSVAGTDVQIVQKTDYPWNGKVSITVNPAAEKAFSVKVRVPNRNVSGLYSSTPAVNAIGSIAVNGQSVTPTIDKGYATITRTWKAGDKIELALPMAVQRVKASPKVPADVGRVALRYGPLIYNIESVDQNVDLVLGAGSALSTEWKSDLLGGVVAIKGAFSNGTGMTAIPNYVRNNRGGRSIVWIKDQ
ncbi:MAG: glycoside hydrolase family 127 protein [Planctomycetota bacterium]|nr:glycoside hydrolase family 127 protein [Planctomycetota bacterium]